MRKEMEQLLVLRRARRVKTGKKTERLLAPKRARRVLVLISGGLFSYWVYFELLKNMSS